MKKNVICIILFFVTSVFATAQSPDRLFYKGKKYSLFNNPLESYYSKSNPRPKQIVKSRSRSSACWRGYIATWKIQNDSLFLKKVKSYTGVRKADLKKMFGTEYKNGKVHAKWFSGELKIPQGELLRYVHMGYNSLYEKEIIITVKNGLIVAEEVKDNKLQKPIYGFRYVREMGVSYPIPSFATLVESSSDTTSVVREDGKVTINIDINPESTRSISFTTPDTSFESTSTVWIDSIRAESDHQNVINQKALDSLVSSFDESYTFSKPLFDKTNYGSVGYVDATSDDMTLIRIVALSNINTRAIINLTFHKKIQMYDARKIADIIVEHVNMVELSY